jgi:hypothetical protein
VALGDQSVGGIRFESESSIGPQEAAVVGLGSAPHDAPMPSGDPQLAPMSFDEFLQVVTKSIVQPMFPTTPSL